jgi:hypothetical protein
MFGDSLTKRQQNQPAILSEYYNVALMMTPYSKANPSLMLSLHLAVEYKQWHLLEEIWH